MKNRLAGAAMLGLSASLWVWFYLLVHHLRPQQLTPMPLIVGMVALFAFSIGSSMAVLGDDLFAAADLHHH